MDIKDVLNLEPGTIVQDQFGNKYKVTDEFVDLYGSKGLQGRAVENHMVFTVVGELE